MQISYDELFNMIKGKGPCYLEQKTLIETTKFNIVTLLLY